MGTWLQHFPRMGIEGEQYALRSFVLISDARQTIEYEPVALMHAVKSSRRGHSKVEGCEFFDVPADLHSCRSASMGSSREALSAGMIPLIMPTNRQIRKAIPNQNQGIKKGPPTKLATRLPIPMPTAQPSMPPA